MVGRSKARKYEADEQRTTFAEADAPVYSIIVELDAGRTSAWRRCALGSKLSEQTLNQILTEMDGFTGSDGMIVLSDD